VKAASAIQGARVETYTAPRPAFEDASSEYGEKAQPGIVTRIVT
jgi:hypothetical protein